MQRYLFDYIYDSTEHVLINELITTSLDEAIEFINTHFMELHAEGQSDISALRLRTEEGETVLNYEMHLDVVS